MTHRHPIAFSAQALTSTPYGIARYVRELLSAMAGLDPRPPLTLFYAGRRAARHLDSRWRQRHLRLPTRLLHAASVTGPLPIEALIGRHRLVHSPDILAVSSWAPLVLTVHDLIVFRMPKLFPGIYTPDHNPGYQMYQAGARAAIPRAQHIICVSEATRRDLLELFDVDPTRVTVVPYGVPEPPPGYAPSVERAPGGPARILFMGRVEHRKNLPTAVRAVALLRARGIEAELMVCGDTSGPEAAAIVAECEELAAGGWLRWRGTVAADRIWTEYAEADALLYPSWYEGFGLPPFEAFKARVPVIAARNSSLEELLEGAALLCDPRRPEEFAATLERVLTDAPERERMIEAGIARASQLTWKRAAEATVAVYDSVA